MSGSKLSLEGISSRKIRHSSHQFLKLHRGRSSLLYQKINNHVQASFSFPSSVNAAFLWVKGKEYNGRNEQPGDLRQSYSCSKSLSTMMATALVFQLGLLLFHQVITLFDLYPFNNVRNYTIRERLAECGVNGVLMAVPVFGFALKVEWMMTAALVIYPALLIGEYFQWWRHYFFGATAAWQELYNRLFKDTIIVLPSIKNNPVPNLEHTLLHGLTLLTSIVTYIAYFTAP